MRSQIAVSNGMSCSTTKIEQPVCCCTLINKGAIASDSRWATPPDGSSKSRTPGSWPSTHTELDDAPGARGELADQLLPEHAQAHQLDQFLRP